MQIYVCLWRMIARIFCTLLIYVSLSLGVQGQSSANPFELSKKSAEDSAEKEAVKRGPSDNPFELQSNGQATKKSSQKSSKPKSVTNVPSNSDSFNIGTTMLLLLPLGMLLTLFRGFFNDFFESAYRDRKFNQFYRRMNSMWVAPNILFYLFFCISITVFACLILQHYGYLRLDRPIPTIGMGVAGVGIYFLLKHSIVYFLGETFDVTKEAGRYSLLILTFNVILGVFLTPFNLLILLGPEEIKGAIIVIGIVLCALVLVLLILRALSISNRLLTQHTMHFFMYLCTIEIAPLFIIAKLMM